jgi:spermidine synthase
MHAKFTELDYRQTPLGELILRRRAVRSLGGLEIYEVKLAGRFLMSSLVNDSELALANLAMDAVGERACDVLLGGLGLGYTAAAVLERPTLRSMTVVESLEPVIEWHTRRLVPLAERLLDDARCRIVQGDFFRIVGVSGGQATQVEGTAGPFDAVLVDIDHSPRCLLHPAHGACYEVTGLSRVARRLRSRGVFALWSADPPDEEFTDRLQRVFARVQTHQVRFRNPLLNEWDRNTIYLAHRDA